MSNYSGLKQDINNNIYENQTQQITGTVLNAILNEMTASLGAGYQFAGVATLGMNPGDPDQRVFYLAGEGIYTSFGGLQVPAGKLGVLKWDNHWTLQTIDGLGGGGANLTGYVSVASTDDLPDEGQPTLGYLCGTNLYLYVGTGGDTKEGKYQDCGSFRGPQGDSVQDVEQTQTSLENGGVNKIKFTLSNGISCEFQVRNGTTSSGLFPTVEALQAAYPNPVVGQYAFVGAGFPADIYVCTTAGTWTDSGEDYDGDNVDLTDYATKAEVNQLEAKVTGLFDAPGMVELYINSNNKWAKSNTKKYLASVVPVQANDVVSLQYLLANVGFRGLFASYPTLGETATNLLASIDAGVLSEEITISQSGYLVIWSFYNDLSSGPLSIVINGRDSTHFIIPVEQQLYRLRTFDSGIKETIDGISEDVNTMSGEVDAIGESVIVANESADSANKKIGNIEREEITLPISLTINGISGDVGSAINIRTTTGYAYVIFQVSAGDTYSVKTRTGTSNNYPYYVYLTDGNDIIKDRKIAKQSSNAIQEEQIVIPSGVTKMWVLQYEATPTNIVVRKSAIKDLQSQVTELKETADTSRMISDNGFFGLETDWWIKDRFLEDTYSAQEESALSAFLTKFRARAGQGVFQVGVISDTHGSGAYSWQNILRYPALVCHRSIAVFNKVVEYCDMAFHGGDLSSDYGTSRIRDLQYMYEIARKFCFSKPFFITKGNHDENNNAFIEADMLHLDWANNTYYVRNFSTFSAVTEDSWDGSPLYIGKTELVSDREFRNMVQHWLSPAGATWGNGAYYFYDDEDAKIRIIVGNSFPVNDNHQVSEDEEYLWLAQTAFNLSEKSNPAEWKVLMLRHTQSTSLTALSNCINAFRTGASWTYGNTSVDFGAMNGGGVTFLAHIHGHEHMNCFSNGAGYFDIGENASFVSLSSLGDASKYGISVLSVDMENGIIYEDTIGGKTWAYNYVTGKLEIQVGDTFRAAPSGLSSPSASSSDTGVATCDGMVVTAVSAGECNITITGSNGSYVYPIKVI